MTTLFLLCVFFSFLVLFYIAYKARPAGNQTGNEINHPLSAHLEQPSKQSLCIGTYNIQSGKDINGKRDLSRAADVIQNCDIVGIQEVYAQTWLGRLLGKGSQAQQLAEVNKMGWLFAATRRRWFREHRGNALLSKTSVKPWKVKMLPDNTGKQYRNFISTSVDLDGIEVMLLITHLHTKKGRQQQLETVLEEFQRHEHAVLLGDLNTKPDNELINALLKDSSFNDALLTSFPEHDHNQRIDWIITKNLKTTAADYEKIGISDHPFYSVNISRK